jgi:hypothetical protein
MILRVTPIIKWLYLASVVLLALGGCTGGDSANRNVFVIVMENKAPADALQGSFMASLAARHGVATNYHAITHPSVPNYLAMISGQTWGVTDDSYHALPPDDLGHQLTTAGVPWRAYMEGLGPAGCLESPLPYDPGHNPFAFFGGGCPPNVVPLTELQADLDRNSMRFYWITPDRCHDTHDCSVADGDAWLQQIVPTILGSKAFTSGGVLFLTYDEDDGSADNRVVMIVITNDGVHRTSDVRYDHYSLLATMEDLLGVGRLGNAEGARPMDDLLGR